MNQKVGVNSELGKYEPEWQINHQLLEYVEICSQASGQSTFESCAVLFHAAQTGIETVEPVQNESFGWSCADAVCNVDEG